MNSKIIVAGNILDEAIKNLKKFNIEIIKTKKCLDVYEEISYHPDIQMFLSNDFKVISPNMYDEYSLDFENNVVKGEKYLEDKYPNNIAYNGCLIGSYYIHNLKYTDKKILEELNKRNIKLIDIKQGYSKCSISIVDDSSVITSDRGIEKVLSKYLDVLYVEPDVNILLGNMIGFIGGATGLVNDNWCINGDINRLKECDKIIDFINLKNKKITCLTDKEIIDIGSIIQIKY